MPLVQLPFPVTALPGRRPGEGQGDLINCFARKTGNLIRWQRVPGLIPFTTPALSVRPPRGQLAVDSYIASVFGTGVIRTTTAGVVQTMSGTLPGIEPATMARNLATPVAVVAVSDGAAYWLDQSAGPVGTVKPYPVNTASANLGPVNSVTYHSGYFVFSRPNNEIVVTKLQSMDWDPLSFARAEASPDTLLRMFSAPPVLLACGTDSIEVLQDVGSSPYPFQRVTVIPCGLIGAWAIAGGAGTWDRPVCFVANDRTVRMLKGYDPIIISTDDIAADIEVEAEAGRADLLRAQVYTHGDNAIWSLSSPTWTWEHNLSTGSWHRRRSYQPLAQHTDEAVPWRAYFATNFDQRWIAQDELDGGLVQITASAHSEPSLFRDVEHRAPLIMRCESGPAKELPANLRLPAIYLDYTVGFDVPGVPDPKVVLTWSHDGGATWANPLVRHLGGRGESRALVTLRSTGRSSHLGMQLRWECSDAVPVVFHGAVAPTARASRPRQVGVVVQGEGFVVG
jgi:hypothetical protein